MPLTYALPRGRLHVWPEPGADETIVNVGYKLMLFLSNPSRMSQKGRGTVLDLILSVRDSRSPSHARSRQAFLGHHFHFLTPWYTPLYLLAPSTSIGYIIADAWESEHVPTTWSQTHWMSGPCVIIHKRYTYAAEYATSIFTITLNVYSDVQHICTFSSRICSPRHSLWRLFTARRFYASKSETRRSRGNLSQRDHVID